MNSHDYYKLLWSKAQVSSNRWPDLRTKDPNCTFWRKHNPAKLVYLPYMQRFADTNITAAHEVFRLYRNIVFATRHTYFPCGLTVWSWEATLAEYTLKISEGQNRVLDFASRSPNITYFLDLDTGRVHCRCATKPGAGMHAQVASFADACLWTPDIELFVDLDGLTSDQMRRILRKQQHNLLRDGVQGVLDHNPRNCCC